MPPPSRFVRQLALRVLGPGLTVGSLLALALVISDGSYRVRGEFEISSGDAAEQEAATEFLLPISGIAVSGGNTPQPTGESKTVNVPVGAISLTGHAPSLGGAALYRAFPEAEGYGAQATWNADSTDACNRADAQVIKVTNTNDAGAGSLRQAIADLRTDTLDVVIPTTGGTITLTTGGLSFTGQTCAIFGFHAAPGGGLQMVREDANVMTFDTDGHNKHLVLRYPRLRMIANDTSVDNQDALTILEAENVIIDHCSVSFGRDETFSITTISTGTRANAGDVTEVTVSNCIIGPGLRPHSAGMLADGVGDGTTLIDSITFHANYWVHNSHRNPLFGDAVHLADRLVLTNEWIYNPRNWFAGAEDSARIDFVANYQEDGPWTSFNDTLKINRMGFDGTDPGPLIFTEKNLVNITGGSPDTADLGGQRNWFYRDTENPLAAGNYLGAAIDDARDPVTRLSAAQARDTAIAYVGASKQLSCAGVLSGNRDALDNTLVGNGQNGTGPSSDAENDTSDDHGGIPTLAAGTACTDTDGGGAPDEWEEANGLNKNSATDDTADTDSDGYTNIEEYLNGTDPQVSG